MPTSVYRSQRVEDLVDALASVLEASWGDDPFEAIPVLIGSRGMERWLRHELATRLGAVAHLAFLFPRTAFDSAARWLLSRPASGDRTPFWTAATPDRNPWSGAHLASRVVPAIRARLSQPRFRRVRDYLGPVGDAVGARELAFAQEVAATLERLLHDRSADALRWASDPASAPDTHAWIGELLSDLDRGTDLPSPARRFVSLRALSPTATGRSLFVFGLSTLQPGDKEQLEVLAQHLDLHVFALAPSREWWQDVRRGVARDGTNTLLAANGEPSRDFQQWLEKRDYREPVELRPPAPASTLLGRVQDWIDRAADNPTPEQAPWRSRASCSSVAIHACHGPLRQCEALRDELLRRFAADPTLEPRHILVTTPDVATYAPLIAATFARHGEGSPDIPLHIADLGIRSTNPVADALLRALDLVDGRVTASRLHDLLAVQPVRNRFGLEDADLADMRTMMMDSGIRWAWDAADRARHEQPALDQNTVRFGLERLALGVLMPDAGNLSVVPSTDARSLPPAVPVEVVSRERVTRFGCLVEVCQVLRAFHADGLPPATGSVWRHRLRTVLDSLTHVGDSSAWLRVQVDQRIDELLPGESAHALPLDRTAVLTLLRGAFELPQHGDRPVTGAVTVCGVEPMRSVPFRIVAMLGLDDGVFPRSDHPAAWDPFSERRPGEHDRRTIDRHLFLESLLCARDALLVFGTGFEAQRGAPAPMSVVVSELAEVVAAGVGRQPDQLAVEHPLQPWSERAFDDDRRRPFDRLWVDAARARRTRVDTGLAATRPGRSWPAEEGPLGAITAEQLASALAYPQKELLGKRLGLGYGRDDDVLADREPLTHDQLDDWTVRDRALRASSGGVQVPVEILEVRLRGEGLLPLSAAGRAVLDAAMEQAREARQQASRIPGDELPPRFLVCKVEGTVVTAVAPDPRLQDAELRLVWLTASKTPNARLQLLSWITLLTATASGTAVRSAHLIGCENSVVLRAPHTPDEARGHLARLLAVRKRVRQDLVPLFPRLSRELLVQRDKTAAADPAKWLSQAAAKWEGGHNAPPGDRQDAWVQPFYGHLSIADLAVRADEIFTEAEGVWGPLLEAERRGRAEPT